MIVMVTISESLLNKLLAEITPDGEIADGSFSIHYQGGRARKYEIRLFGKIELEEDNKNSSKK
ncbi:MAG: hypothetical protein DDT19_02290 [Syntrophomonadaceae bacterium]|nr:hypothetical protein [Bacillota bacterium]